MTNSKYITATKGRLEGNFQNMINNQINNSGVYTQINKTVEDSKASKGIVTKFYPYLDKCEVKLNRNGETVLCTILHRFGGELIDFYTPNGDADYCSTLHEPCIIPRGELEGFVLPVHENDGTEWIFLGYFLSEEVLEFNPAAQGNLKIICIGGNNHYWIKFGYDGLEYRGISEPSISVGDYDEDMEDIDYYKTSDVVLDYENGLLKERLSSHAEYNNGTFKF